jgi:chorismate mutase
VFDTRLYVAEKSISSLLCTEMTKDTTAAITSLVYKFTVQCNNFMRQGASFMFAIAACTVQQMFVDGSLSLCVLLLQNTDSCCLALHPEGRKIRFVGLSRCMRLCVSLHFER